MAAVIHTKFINKDLLLLFIQETMFLCIGTEGYGIRPDQTENAFGSPCAHNFIQCKRQLIGLIFTKQPLQQNFLYTVTKLSNT